MKRFFLSIIAALVACTGVYADGSQTTLQAAGVKVTNKVMKREGKMLRVAMDMQLSDLDVESRRVVLLTPRVSKGDNVRELNAVGIYGRDRYYHYLRANGADMLSGQGETVIRASRMPDTQHYEMTIPYESWMEGADLSLLRQDYGCCNDVEGEDELPLVSGFSSVYSPVYLYERPQAEAHKMRALSGSAFINFPVNRTEIRTDYMSNTTELRKITATIDSVKNDRDITIQSITIKGFASPEGTYANNTRLAKGRTQALKEHVSRMYRFDKDFIKTSYEPENWEGLRTFVAQSGIAHRDQILAMIDGSMEPDAKERQIKTTYPAEYQYLLRECYPSLRRSDYKIEYEIKQYTETSEILEVLRTQPSKLSLDEFFVAAQTMEPGSKEFDETFETAARMYPDDEVANMNAANSAMKRADYEGAARYLAKAGNSAKAQYAKAVLAAHQGKYTEAAQLFSEGKAAGVSEAAAELDKIKDLAY